MKHFPCQRAKILLKFTTKIADFGAAAASLILYKEGGGLKKVRPSSSSEGIIILVVSTMAPQLVEEANGDLVHQIIREAKYKGCGDL